MERNGDLLVSNIQRALKVALLTFTISLIISFFSQAALAFWLSLSILFFVILTGIIFDIIGTAVTAATEAPFHAMGADKVAGSKQAIYLVRHAAKVANFCSDVVGDISGTISGAMVAGIILQVARNQWITEDLMSAIAISLTAALTVGGKALGKSYAIHRANEIVFLAGKFLSLIKIIRFDMKKTKRKSKNNTNSKKARKSP